MDKAKNIEIKCTPTYEKHLSDSSRRPIPFGFRDWFYLAYPDVVIWFNNNS